ncbi:MAG: DUF342 domain-containing protein [Bacillus sp. (in: firmicutes)]
MSSLFDITISNDQLTAVVILRKDAPADNVITAEQIKEELQNKNVIFGIKENILKSIADAPEDVTFPLVIAEGDCPEVGEDGYIVDKTTLNEEKRKNAHKAFNFRDVIKIPSVTNGQLIAEVIPPSIGKPGIDVFGNSIPAVKGKPVKIIAGKNVMVHDRKFYATLDGQLSITTDQIHVFPVFEVNGDLDLKIGNIDFIGNVVIRGNVPSGYTVKAGGDIHVKGLVEAAHLIAGGSIHISGGIAGGMRGRVEAEIDIHSNYFNQAICSAGQNIFVDRAILHSQVTSGGKIVVRSGHIIGGEMSAAKSVEAVDFGNHHYMQTIIKIGMNQKLLEREVPLKKELATNKDSLMKLYMLSQRLKQRMETVDALTTEENQLLRKQELTVSTLNKRNAEIEEELVFIKEELLMIEKESFVKSKGEIFPNSQIYFGKYSKNVQTVMSKVRITIHNSEIISVPL